MFEMVSKNFNKSKILQRWDLCLPAFMTELSYRVNKMMPAGQHYWIWLLLFPRLLSKRHPLQLFWIFQDRISYSERGARTNLTQPTVYPLLVTKLSVTPVN